MRDIPNNLPFQSTPFVGRTKELAEIARLLGDPVCRLLSLVGPGGIGKTRLALEAANQHLETYPDGVYFVPLAALSSPDYIVAATAEAFCCKINQGGDALQQLLNHLREKQALLVMDNFEHLLEGAEVVSQMLAQAPALKIIVTSREALNLQEEWLRPVIGMGFPDVAARDAADLRLEDYSAVQMFVQHARRMRADFSLEKERAGVIEICALVEGMPLALELAATWVRVLSCDEIAREIRRSLDFLETRSRNVQPRHRSMRVVLDQSWGRLEQAEQAVFEQLAVFRGGFTRDAAQAVAGADLPVLSALTDKSLLRRDAAGRYDLHELVRQYGEEQLNNAPEESARTRGLHCAYYMTFLQQRWPKMLGPKPKETMHEIEQEIKNVRAAWRWAIDHRLETEIEKGLDSLWFFYDTRSWYREGHKALVRAADALRSSPPEDSLILGKILARQGVLSGSLNWSAEATALLEESLAIFRRLDNHREIAFALARLGEVASYSEHYEEARKYFEDSFALYEEIGDRWEQAFALNWLGHMIRDMPQQLALRKRCLAIFQELNSQWGVAIATVSLGQSAFHMGDYGEALRLGQIGFGLSQEIDIQWNVILALQLLGGVAFKTGKYLEAKWCFEQALQMALDVQLSRFVRHSATGMARVLVAIGQKAQAMELYAVALRYAVESAARHHLERIKRELSPDDLAAVLARSQEIEPESAVRALLADLERMDEAGEDEDEAAAVPLSAPPASTQLSMDYLTERELEILRLVAEGRSNREIAAELVLALGTVKWYISQIFGKLGAASRTQAVARARELSLLQ